jgi:hypothetical protein
MKIIRIMAALLGFALLTAGSGYYTARADEWDKTTKITFSDTVQVPGTVLPAGTYIFKLLDDPANRHIVRIFRDDNTTLVTTILAIPNERLKPTEKTVLTYKERPANQPPAVEAWFYPGNNTGQQFVYPKTEAAELSRLNHVEVPSTGTETAYDTSTKTSAPAAVQTTEVAENREAPASAYQSTSNTTQAAPSRQEPERLPQTASSLPIIGLAGFVLVGAALALRAALREARRA